MGVENPQHLPMPCFLQWNLCLRGGHEHYALKLSQFEFGVEMIMCFIVKMVLKTVHEATKISYKIKTSRMLNIVGEQEQATCSPVLLQHYRYLL